MKLVDEAVAAGASHAWAAALLGVSDDRVHRWRTRRRSLGTLLDRAPGGSPVHGLLLWEEQAILDLVEEWGPVDRSHRKLAHRGSYLGRLWVAPSTLRRVLQRHGLVLPQPPGRQPVPKPAWPEWLCWRPNCIWCWDVTHFPRARRVAFAIADVVSRKWVATLLSSEETSSQVRVLFDQALVAEGLSELLTPERVDLPASDPRRPILLAVSDNGPQMTSRATKEYLARLAIAQRLGRPGTPTDQAWIESLFGHVKVEWPHLEQIRDPAVLEAELERVRGEYNGLRLHAGIGYVTPADEHEGRGPSIRRARRDGLVRARQARIAYHRSHHP